MAPQSQAAQSRYGCGVDRERTKLWGWAAAAVGGVMALVVSWMAAVVGLRWVAAIIRGARFSFRLATLTAYRRCPDCFRVLRREARVCRSCGARVRRRPGAPGR